MIMVSFQLVENVPVFQDWLYSMSRSFCSATFLRLGIISLNMPFFPWPFFVSSSLMALFSSGMENSDVMLGDGD